SNFSHSICLNDDDIKTPTMMRAGAVTYDVIMFKSGEKNSERRKNPAATTTGNHDGTPTATPTVDSIYAVVVDVPSNDPKTVPDASANKALPARGSLLFFINPAGLATATSVPAVSKKSTKIKVKITTSISTVKIFSKCIKA